MHTHFCNEIVDYGPTSHQDTDIMEDADVSISATAGYRRVTQCLPCSSFFTYRQYWKRWTMNLLGTELTETSQYSATKWTM